MSRSVAVISGVRATLITLHPHPLFPPVVQTDGEPYGAVEELYKVSQSRLKSCQRLWSAERSDEASELPTQKYLSISLSLRHSRQNGFVLIDPVKDFAS